MDRIVQGKIDRSLVNTHRAGLADWPKLYQTFNYKKDGCVKVMLKP